MDESYGDVHTSHCCKWHGCKYSGLQDDACSVEDLYMKQEGPCEWCYMDWKEYIKPPEFQPEWIEYIKKWKDDGGTI